MQRLYLAYQMHTIEHYGKATRLAERLSKLGYTVHLAVNHMTAGVLDGKKLHVHSFETNARELQDADVVCLCIDDGDTNGVELEVGMLLGFATLGMLRARVLVCNLHRGLSHPLGDLYVSSTERNAAMRGGISQHFEYIENLGTLLDELRVEQPDVILA